MDLNEIKIKLNDSMLFRRFEKIDWKQIASVNMDQLKLSSDCDIIEKNIRNILCCHIESEFDQKNMDVNLVVKLFKLAQISLEYLLHIRQQIMTELHTERGKISANVSMLNSITKEKEELAKKFKDLKKETKKNSASPYYFRCPICPKTFVNGDFLKSHIQRRHQEVFEVRNQVQTLQAPVVENAVPTSQTVPIASPAPSTAADVSKDEINEFKMRLHVTEKKLEEDKMLLNAILEKVDKSNDSLQGLLLKEVEKIRSSLNESRAHHENKPPVRSMEKEITVVRKEPAHHQDVQIQNSPIKLSSAAAQTTPRLLSRTAASVGSSQDSTDSHSASSEQQSSPSEEPEMPIESKIIPICTPSIEVKPQPSKPISEVKVVQVRQELAESSSSEDTGMSSSSSSDEDSDDQEASKRVIQIRNAANVKKIDQNLFNRFKQTIENAFEQRLKQMGIESKKGLPSSKYRRVIQQLEDQRRQKSGSAGEFDRIRQAFENQLRNRLPKKKQLHDSENVGVLSTKKASQFTLGVNKIQTAKAPRQKNLESSPVKLLPPKGDETPPFNRAPVPTPRTRQQQQPSTSLMSRNGEAADSSFHSPKGVKGIAESLEREIKTRSIRPPLNSVDTFSVNKKEPEPITVQVQQYTENEDEDSFSLSSLDEILAQLKRPKVQTSTPKAQRSVQWKDPVESSQLEPDNSWDSDED